MAKVIRTAIHVLFALIFIGTESGCSHAQKNKEKPVEVRAGKDFTLPDIPQMLTSGEERAAYLAAHYWDNFDFTDTTQISQPEITEQAFVDFLDILPYVQPEKSQKAMTALIVSASADSAMYVHFAELAEKYLYDPNSPFRNEDLYIPVLNHVVLSSGWDEARKVRPQYQLKMAMKNRPGSIAADFSYTTPDGTVARMTSVKADYLLLFFNNPDCNDCRRVKDYIKHSEIFNRLTRADSSPLLRILAVYPDADLALWESAEYPDIMINSYDAGQTLMNKELYDLKAIPTFYLLDKKKRVILKDVSIERVEGWLQMR